MPLIHSIHNKKSLRGISRGGFKTGMFDKLQSDRPRGIFPGK